VINVVTGSTPVSGEALVESRDINMVSFTGSTGVGVRIGEVGGRTMKRLLLELGGKGAALVFDDADLKTAIQMIGSTWTFHSGQICTAPTRAIIHRNVYDQVVGGLAKMAGVLKVGDPYEPDTVVGPVITAAHRDRVESYVDAGRSEGGEVVAGGQRPEKPDRGFYVAPTLIAGCRAGMKVVQEEIFGPVVVAIPFDDEDEGIALANGTDFGLYDYVFSADTARAFRVSKRLRAGNVGINTTQRNHNTPFGGTKWSGVGRDGGVFGLHAYTELQSVVWPG
jgi:acyl-CoA reductase-like NAD-dependent aldehyde dehydrogenase